MGRAANNETETASAKKTRSGASKKAEQRWRGASADAVLDSILEPKSRLSSETQELLVALHKDGQSFQEIADYLNSKSIRAPHRGRWWPRIVEGELELALAAQGERMPGPLPAAVQRMVETRLSVAGCSLGDVARSLNEEGLSREDGGDWSASGVYWALRRAHKAAVPGSESEGQLAQALLGDKKPE